MARLFITPKEIDFISDLTKEITKDIIGTKIYYYSVREDISNVHYIYEEAIDKVFDPPVIIDCRVSWTPSEQKSDKFGYETTSKLEVYIHLRDVIDRNIKLQTGDYMSHGDNFFEITNINDDKIIFGQVEQITGYTLTAVQARRGLIDKKPLGPTRRDLADDDAIQEVFEQQRGFGTFSDGSKTGDKRVLIEDGTLEQPIDTPQKINKSNSQKSSFYGDN